MGFYYKRMDKDDPSFIYTFDETTTIYCFSDLEGHMPDELVQTIFGESVTSFDDAYNKLECLQIIMWDT